MKARLLGLLAAALLAAAPAVNAVTLLGSTVSILYDDRIGDEGGTILEGPFTVDVGPEVSCPAPSGTTFGLCDEGILLDTESIDIGEHSVAFDLSFSGETFLDPALFSFLFATGPGSVAVIGAEVTSVVNLERDGVPLGLDGIMFELGENVLTVDLSLVTVRSTDSGRGSLELKLTLAEETPEPIPEPSTYVLLGAGLLGLLALRRRSPARAA